MTTSRTRLRWMVTVLGGTTTNLVLLSIWGSAYKDRALFWKVYIVQEMTPVLIQTWHFPGKQMGNHKLSPFVRQGKSIHLNTKGYISNADLYHLLKIETPQAVL